MNDEKQIVETRIETGIEPPETQTAEQTVGQTVGQPVVQTVGQSAGQSAVQTVGQSVVQTVGQTDVITPEVVNTEKSSNGEEKVKIGKIDISVTAENAKNEALQSASKSQVLSAEAQKNMMKKGESRFGVTSTGDPIGKTHWIVDSSTCGDIIMSLPQSVLIAARSGNSGIAVNVRDFIDAIVEGASKCEGINGIAECAKIPVWAVSRMFGTFPVLQNVYAEAMDEFVITVEAAAMKSATWNRVKKSHMSQKTKTLPDGQSITESVTETDDVVIPPDPTLSKLILQSRMRNRYKEDTGSKQAVIINITGPEAGL